MKTTQCKRISAAIACIMSIAMLATACEKQAKIQAESLNLKLLFRPFPKLFPKPLLKKLPLYPRKLPKQKKPQP